MTPTRRRPRCSASAFSAGRPRSQSRKLDISGQSAVPAGAISQSPSPDPSVDTVAAVARMVAETAGDQQIDLALDQLVQAGGLQHPQADFFVPCAKRRQLQAAQIEAAVHAELQQHRAHRLQLRGRIGNATKAVGNFRQIGLTGLGQDELLMQPLEQAYAQTRFQRLHLLPHGGRCHMQFMRGQLEAEMPRCGFERAERIEGGRM